jgi:hypothetical protein
MVDITIVNGVYKPTYNWGAHIVCFMKHIQLSSNIQHQTPPTSKTPTPISNFKITKCAQNEKAIHQISEYHDLFIQNPHRVVNR